jgi:hypothetical protein
MNRASALITLSSYLLFCTQSDFRITTTGDFRIALNAAAAHIVPLNQIVTGELQKHRIIIVGSVLDPRDLGLTNWSDQR